ncbi:MAG: DNA polymerase I [Candidatus Neomarinimicrobiota bacterium]|nr:MAG: DNA polymerase I [Candidatus Neomarinimicrobiota bacterium]
MRLIRQETPDYLVALFDTSQKTFRHDRFPEYKATRQKMPEELQDQLPYLWKILRGMRIPTLSKEGFEADDLIGTIAVREAREGLQVYIVSGDKDFMQLVSDRIFLYAPGGRNMEMKIYGPNEVEQKWGLPPDKIVDLLGLMGDSSDNVPGVRGVGEKSAVKLIQAYGSLEGALEAAEQISNKRVRNGLLECREEALLSKALVTIDTSVDIDIDLEEMRLHPFDLDELIPIFEELEFRGLVTQVMEYGDPDFVPADRRESPEKNYQCLLNPEEISRWFTSIPAGSWLSVDLETTSTDPMQAEIVGFSFSWQPHAGIYIPVRYPDGEETVVADLNALLKVLQPVLESESLPKTGQNIKYDALILKRHGITVRPIRFDTMIAAHLLNPDRRSYKLDLLSQENLNYTMVPITDLIGTGRNQITMDRVPLDTITFYAVEDADVALQLTPLFQRRLQEEQLEDFFHRVEIPLLAVLQEMEFQGVFVDRKQLEVMSDRFHQRIEELKAEIRALAEEDFNPNSTQQLAAILFDRLGLPKIKSRSTAEDVLQRLKEVHPLPGKILEYRKLSKLVNTYLDPLPSYIHPETGRIHSSFSQTVAATGRLSSSNPNFQNIPVRTEEGRDIRKAFCPQEKGWKIFSADYSQIELRIMAHLSQDPGLLAAFQQGEDVHSRTASLVFGVPLESVTADMRRVAKVVNFGIMYGAGPFRISQELSIPMKEAQSIIDVYFREYQGIQSYIDRVLEQAREEHYVSTMLGRRRPVWDADSDNRLRREAAERMAINMPIQGTAAEMIKLAMIQIHHDLLEKQFRARMILQIHDELLFEVPEEEIPALRELVKDRMENALPLSIPVVVDCGVGNSWYEAH